MAEDVYIAIGSNIEPFGNIPHAVILLKKYVTITSISDFYKTRAVGSKIQDDFLNGILKIKTEQPPRNLKYEILRKIEEKLTRNRSDDKFAPRTIDLDLILYEQMVIDEPDLKIPDPNIRHYPFIAIPLARLAPDLILPDTMTPLKSEPVLKQTSDLNLQHDFTNRLRNLNL